MADAEDPPIDGEPFLRRWSRRKAQARGGRERLPEGPAAPGGREETESQDEREEGLEGSAFPASGTGAEAGALPDPQVVDEESDVSAFLMPGVDSDLQQRALRRLFRSPKFNVVDGLDVYDGDYRSFESLGQVITAHLRHRMRFEAEKALRQMAEPSEKRDQGARRHGLAADGQGPFRTDDPPDPDEPETEPT